MDTPPNPNVFGLLKKQLKTVLLNQASFNVNEKMSLF